MTQQELAKAAGITQASLSDIETGRSAGMHSDTLMAIARVLREDPEYIRTGRRPPTSASDPHGHGELVQLADTLTPENRRIWLEVGRLLFGQQSKGKLVENLTDDAPKVDRVAVEVSKTIRELLEKYGPDEVARILADFEGAAGQQATKPKKGSKARP